MIDIEDLAKRVEHLEQCVVLLAQALKTAKPDQAFAAYAAHLDRVQQRIDELLAVAQNIYARDTPRIAERH
jgi:citrate synthase